MFDLRDSWWAVETGLVDEMPKVERVVYVPTTVEALPQLYINNDLDTGRALQVGNFEAAQAQNPNLRSWNTEGPVWGAPDGCVYRMSFNHQKPPWDDPELHWAVNYALNREEIIELGYEGSTFPAIAPLSSYGGIQAYVGKLQDIFDEFQVDTYDPEKTAEIMTGKGYAKNEDGFWAEDGETLQLTIQMFTQNPAGPVMAQQLKEAGFDVKVDALQSSVAIDNVIAGNFEASLGTHCGSTYDPWLTLQHYHGKFAAPEGESIKSVRANTRYENPELDAILDKMEGMVPSADDPEYLELVREALSIYLRDLPDISYGEELHVLVFNENYWTGYPTVENPIMHPYIPWEGWALVIHSMEPTQ
jgi:peptide/nickel transport system substrate-binding protein